MTTITRKEMAELAGITLEAVASYARGKHSKLPKILNRIKNTFYYDKVEAENWAANYLEMNRQKAEGTFQSKPEGLPMQFQMTIDERIRWRLKLMKAKQNKPKTVTVKVEELNIWSIR
jgi:transcriptional regulator with XRE-family HTH domain